MRQIKDSNSEYVQCENSNLRFHGTKLDRNGNECAVFSTPNHNTFSIQRNSLWGTQSWNTGTKSTMDAETFLAKNPKVSLESLERDVIKLANETNAAWGKNIRVHNKQILDSKIKDADGDEKYRAYKLFEEKHQRESWERAYKLKYPNGLSKVKDLPYKEYNRIKEEYALFRVWVENENPSRQEVESKLEEMGYTYDNEYAYLKSVQVIWVSPLGKEFEWGVEVSFKEGVAVDTEWGTIDGFENRRFTDSKKIKDANDAPDVLDGVLFIGFTDGTEDDMIAEVNKHKNESGEIDGVQYETYETDSSDGVAMIDMCAATDDANAFVKALLKKWGIAKNVADLEFEASDEMKEAVNDSRKVKDNRNSVGECVYHLIETQSPKLFAKLYNKLSHSNNDNELIDWCVDLLKSNKYECTSPNEKPMARHFASNGKYDLYWDGYEIEVWTNNQVSDSRKVKDSQSQYQQKYEEIARLIESKIKGLDLTATQAEKILHKKGLVLYKTKGTYYNYWAFADDNAFDNVLTIKSKHVGIWLEQQYITDDFYITGVGLASEEGKGVPEEALADSRKVNDMTKPAHLRGYAEKVRANRRKKNDEQDAEKENEKQDVADSRRVRDEYGTVAYFTTIGKNKHGEDRYHVEIVNKLDKGDFVVDEFDVDNYTEGFIMVKELVWKIYINGRPIWEN